VIPVKNHGKAKFVSSWSCAKSLCLPERWYGRDALPVVANMSSTDSDTTVQLIVLLALSCVE